MTSCHHTTPETTMQNDDLDAQLAALAQHLANISFSMRVILELRAAADHLTLPLAAELRTIWLLISRLLPRLPETRL
jgi:hypothetical protein